MEQELIVIPSDLKSEGKMGQNSKRGLATEPGDQMVIEVDQDRVNQLQAQIAVLQRELAKVNNKSAMSSTSH